MQTSKEERARWAELCPLSTGLPIARLLADYDKLERKVREFVQNCGACGGLGETCYCRCHSSVSSRPFCIHCRPEQFNVDPYCHPCENCAALRAAIELEKSS